MRRIISLSRDTQKAIPPNGVVYSPLGSRIPLASLIQALSANTRISCAPDRRAILVFSARLRVKGDTSLLAPANGCGLGAKRQRRC
jgi:hypothetical protein